MFIREREAGNVAIKENTYIIGELKAELKVVKEVVNNILGVVNKGLIVKAARDIKHIVDVRLNSL